MFLFTLVTLILVIASASQQASMGWFQFKFVSFFTVLMTWLIGSLALWMVS